MSLFSPQSSDSWRQPRNNHQVTQPWLSYRHPCVCATSSRSTEGSPGISSKPVYNRYPNHCMHWNTFRIHAGFDLVQHCAVHPCFNSNLCVRKKILYRLSCPLMCDPSMRKRGEYTWSDIVMENIESPQSRSRRSLSRSKHPPQTQHSSRKVSRAIVESRNTLVNDPTVDLRTRLSRRWPRTQQFL